METRKIACLFFLLLLTLVACEKDEDSKPLPEVGYPTIYKPLNNGDWNTQNLSFQNLDPTEGLSLNEYGFLAGTVEMDDSKEINALTVFAEVEGIIQKYAEFLGMEEETNVVVQNELFAYTHSGIQIGVSDYFTTEFNEAGNSHSFYLSQKVLNEIGVENTQLCFTFRVTEKTIGISGNWFPTVLIPKDKIYSKEEAFEIAVKYEKQNSNQQFSREDENIGMRVTLLPVLVGENTEIHECWRVTFWDISHIFFIDTQTGDVLKFVDYTVYI